MSLRAVPIAVPGLVLLSLLSASAMEPIDCFPVGLYGVRQDDPVITSGALNVRGWRPVFMAVVDLDSDVDDCEFVYPVDVFRLMYKRADTSLLAGCSGDFNGDGQQDYALLLQRLNREVLPFAFLHKERGYVIEVLPPVSDHDGFDVDRSSPPGPFCRRRPASGKFTFETEYGVDTCATQGDIFVIGWDTYAWSDSGFLVIHMAD